MTLRPWMLIALPMAALAAAYTGCTADVEEGCLTGPCGEVTSATGAGGSIDLPDTGGAGGGGGQGGGVACEGDEFPATGKLPCAVFDVMQAKCLCCHQDPELNGAAFPLLTYADTHQPYGSSGKLRWERMSEVIQDSSALKMPFSTAADLTSSEKKVLDDWFAACAPPAEDYDDGGDPEGCEGDTPPAMCEPP